MPCFLRRRGQLCSFGLGHGATRGGAASPPHRPPAALPRRPRAAPGRRALRLRRGALFRLPALGMVPLLQRGAIRRRGPAVVHAATCIHLRIRTGTLLVRLSVARYRVLPAMPYAPALLSYQIRDIGFLRYYRKEQLPNFALAAPMLAVTAAGVAAYWRADPHRVATLGLATQRMYTKPRELTALEQAVRLCRCARHAHRAEHACYHAQAPMCAADQRKRCAHAMMR